MPAEGPDHRSAASAHFQARGKRCAQHLGVVCDGANLSIKTVQPEQPEGCISAARVEGFMGGNDALPTVGGSEDLRVRSPCCLADGPPDLHQGRVVEAVFELVDNDSSAWSVGDDKQARKEPNQAVPHKGKGNGGACADHGTDCWNP